MTIRPYFNAGLLIVRPELRLLRAWPGAFQKAAADKELTNMCRQDQRKMVFLHQAALA
jgi:2-oxo-4-hydroxy-4-carboxy--5-ureidoimidazoline (OHCU) decarboxylase